MCLQMITKRYDKPTTEEQTAYKAVAFSWIGCEQRREYVSAFQETPLPLNKWIQARPVVLETDNWIPDGGGQRDEGARKKYTSG